MRSNNETQSSAKVLLTDAYSACAVCSPPRAAILTGKHPARILLTDWLPSGRWNPKAKLRDGRFLRGLPLEEFTLAEAPEGIELYNLEDDLSETTDLASQRPELAADLLRKLDAWRHDVGAQMMKPNPDYDREFYDWCTYFSRR